MDKFAKEARKATKIGIKAPNVGVVSKRLKNALPANLNKSLGRVNVGRSARFGEINFGKAPMRKVVPDLRRGNLNQALYISGNATKLSGAVEKNTKQLFRKRFPDVEIYDTRQRKARVVGLNKDLDKRNFSDLTPAAQAKANGIWAKLNRKKGTIIAGFTKLAVAGGIAAVLLTKAAANRDGCWAIVNTNGKNVYCKLTRRSCGQAQGGDPCDPKIDSYTAGHLYYVVLLSKNKPTLRSRIEQATGKTIDFTNFEQYIADNADKLTELYGDLGGADLQVTGQLCQDAAGAPITGCVMCDPSADPTTRNYVDASDLDDNVTYQCIQNSTILDVLNDLGDNVIDLGGKAFDGIGNIFKYAWIFVGIIAVIFGAVIALRFLPSRNNGGGGGSGGAGSTTTLRLVAPEPITARAPAPISNPALNSRV